MNREDIFPSRYFKAADLMKPLTVQISSAELVEMKNMAGELVDRLVIGFHNQKKRLVVNRTNYDAIADLHGDNTNQWAGQQIQLYTDKIHAGGKLWACVRVRAAT